MPDIVAVHPLLPARPTDHVRRENSDPETSGLALAVIGSILPTVCPCNVALLQCSVQFDLVIIVTRRCTTQRVPQLLCM